MTKVNPSYIIDLSGKEEVNQMFKALCTGCGQTFPIGPQAEAVIAEGEGKAKGYCATVRQWVAMELSTKAQG